MFGTMYKSGEFRLAVKIIDRQGKMLVCQTLTQLNKFVAHEKYFIPAGDKRGMLLLASQIEEYEKLNDDYKNKCFSEMEPDIIPSIFD